MKLGDLVTLRGRAYYIGVDAASRRHYRVNEGALGIFIKRAVPEDSNDHRFSDVYVLTEGKLVACAPGVWSPVDETR